MSETVIISQRFRATYTVQKLARALWEAVQMPAEVSRPRGVPQLLETMSDFVKLSRMLDGARKGPRAHGTIPEDGVGTQIGSQEA